VPKNKNIVIAISGMLAVCGLSLGAVNTTIIGMVSSDPGQAGVAIDGARVSSNATLFDGSQVASAGYSRLQLNSGTRVNLSANSTLRVFANHASLESGASELQGGMGYAIDARSLRIKPAEEGSIARVRLDGEQRVLVTAVAAPVNVWNSAGVLVARVLPESPMSFLPQAAASNAFSNSGCVINKSGAPVLADETGNQVFELRSGASGVDPRTFVGKRASVSGTLNSSMTPIAGATQVVVVTAMTIRTGADCAPIAAKIGGTMTIAGVSALGAAPAVPVVAAGAAAGSGALIGGVVAVFATAGILGGMAAAGVFNKSP